MTPEEVRVLIWEIQEGLEMTTFQLAALVDVCWFTFKTWELMGPVTVDWHTQEYAPPTAEQIEKLKQIQREERVS